MNQSFTADGRCIRLTKNELQVHEESKVTTLIRSLLLCFVRQS